MKLSRRDALLALSVVGAGGMGEIADRVDQASAEGLTDQTVIDALAAVAPVVYPSEIESSREFVRTYVLGRVANREEHREGIGAAVAALDDCAERAFGSSVAELDIADRETLLREVGVDRAYPQPDGTVPERIRFYVVNELLYALYTTPTGGRLIGNENPVGYPGGTEAYQRGPPK